MADYTVKPPLAQKNHPPLPRQKVVYKEGNGDLFDAIIHAVDIPKIPGTPGHSDDGKYYNVSVSTLFPGNDPHPGKVIRDGHIYWTDLGVVTDDPCGPPWPG
jgi:hypothetical protein